MAENYGLPYTGSKSMTSMAPVKSFNVTERLYTVKK